MFLRNLVKQLHTLGPDTWLPTLAKIPLETSGGFATLASLLGANTFVARMTLYYSTQFVLSDSCFTENKDQTILHRVCFDMIQLRIPSRSKCL